MVRLVRTLVAIALMSSILMPGCDQPQDSQVIWTDPFDELVERLQLTEDQADQLRSGTGVLQLTAPQVELLRPIVEEVLEEPEHEEWLGEARWAEIQDIYGGVLADGKVDLQRVADLANDIYENLQHDEAVEVATSLVRLSEEEAHLADELGTWSAFSETSTLLYTPRGIEEGDKDFSPNPTMWGSTFAWANHVSVANAESGGIGVHTDAALGMGSAQASARQRIIIHVPHDDTDVEIEAVIIYQTAITHVFSDVAGTHISYSDMPSGKLVRDVIDPLFGWRAAIEKVAGTLESVIGIVLVGKSLSEVMDAVRLYGDFYDYDEMRRALLKAGAERRHVTHSASSLPAGFYAFEIGLGAQAVSVLLGAATAVGIGQVTQIEVTQSVQEEPIDLECIPMVAAGGWSTGGLTVGLKSDGTVVAVGANLGGACDVGEWNGIVQVAAGGGAWDNHTLGVKADGTVVATGSDSYEQCDVDEWTDIVQVDGGAYHTLGLKSDGTVVAVGRDNYGQCDVGGWTGIVRVAAGGWHTVGLRSDGTVVAVGRNNYGQCDVEAWTDIVQVDAGLSHTVGLKSDGTVVAVGRNNSGQCDVDDWMDIVQVTAGSGHTVGLKPDGTVVAVGTNYDKQCNVGGWTDIVQVAAGSKHTVGLRSDGTVVAVGLNLSGQCNVGDWMLIV